MDTTTINNNPKKNVVPTNHIQITLSSFIEARRNGSGSAACVSSTLNSCNGVIDVFKIIHYTTIKIDRITLNNESRCSMFSSIIRNTWGTSMMELSRWSTKCRYMSDLVLSTLPSWVSWTLYSSTFTMAPVTFPKILLPTKHVYKWLIHMAV